MKTPDPTMTRRMPDDPDNAGSDWPFAVRDVEAVLAKIEHKARQRQGRRRRAVGGVIAALTVVVLAVTWVVPFLRDTASVATVTAHRQSVALADGSLAELNAQTSMQTDFRHGRRIVRLDRGEAFFAVARNSGQPFVVETPAGTITVTGTRFNVRLSDGRAEITLMAGAVTVQAPAPGPRLPAIDLVPGEQLVTGETGTVVRRLDEAELEGIVAWREGRLVLDGGTLADAVERLATYHGRQIGFSPRVSDLRTGGSVALQDLEAALAALEATLPIRVLPTHDGNYRIVER